MSRDSTDIITTKEIAIKIESFFTSRKDFLAFSAVNQKLHGIFKEKREKVLHQGKIILGNNATFFLTFSGDLYTCGNNYYRQLGLGDRKERVVWTKTGPLGKKVTRVISKPGNTFAFCEDGLYACGTNSWGQFGLGDDCIKEGWHKIGPVDKKIVDVEATLEKIFLRCENTWYGAGRNAWGEFGTGDTKARWEWVEIKVQGKGVSELKVQDTYTLVRCEDTWYGSGSNQNCELISQKRQDCVLEWVKVAPGRKILELISTPHTIFVRRQSGWYARGGNERGRPASKMFNEKGLDWIRVENHGKKALKLFTSDSGETIYIYCKDGWYSRGIDPFFRNISLEDMDPDRFIPFDQIDEHHKNQCDIPFWSTLRLGNKEIIEIKSHDGKNIFVQCQDVWYGFGENRQGQLGTGTNKKIQDWIKIGPAGKPIFKLFSKDRSFILCEDGWYGCGNNFSGQLGMGDTMDRLHWTKIPLPAEPAITAQDECEAEPLKLTL